MQMNNRKMASSGKGKKCKAEKEELLLLKQFHEEEDEQLPNMSSLLRTQSRRVFSAVNSNIKKRSSPSSNSLDRKMTSSSKGKMKKAKEELVPLNQLPEEEDDPKLFEDEHLANMRSLLRTQSSRVFSAVDNDIKYHSSPSSDSLKETVDALVIINNTVVDSLYQLHLRDDIKKDPALLYIIKNSLEDYSEITLNFYQGIQTCLSQAPNLANNDLSHSGKRSDILQKLMKSLNEFAENLNSKFNSFYQHQLALLGKLNLKEKKFKGKMKSLKIWKKVVDVFSCVISVALKICSVVFGIPLHDTVYPDVSQLVANTIFRLFLDSKEEWLRKMIEITKHISAAVDTGEQKLIRFHEQEEIMVLVDKLEMIISDQVLNDFRTKVRDFSAMVEGIKNKIRSGREEFEEKMKHIRLTIITTTTQSPKCCCRIM